MHRREDVTVNEHNCFNCLFGGDGDERDDYGYCYKHKGASDFDQPPKDQGCEEWKEDLKTCPFCGSEAEVYGECDMVKIQCSNYDCGCSLSGWFDDIEEAAEDWNRRVS